MKGQIKWRYKKVITESHVDAWSKGVFQSTLREYLMQSQQFDPSGSCKTYDELKKILKDPAAFEYLVSTAVIGYLRELNHCIPEIVDLAGESCLNFRDFKFEIISSNLENSKEHQIAISFYSDWLWWIDSVGDHVLCAKNHSTDDKGTLETFMLKPQPNLQIAFYKSHDQ